MLPPNHRRQAGLVIGAFVAFNVNLERINDRLDMMTLLAIIIVRPLTSANARRQCTSALLASAFIST